jgi:Raf kinase inhibitor-like YbhB/YbcL family protein
MKRVIALVATMFLVLAVGCGSDADDSRESLNSTSGAFTLSSNDFIPEHGSPQLSWRNAPEGTKSFAIIIDDHSADNWVHWSLFNINSKLNSIDSQNIPMGSLTAVNEVGNMAYADPERRDTNVYVAHIYALSIDDVTHIEGKSIDNIVNKVYDHNDFVEDFGFYILGEAEIASTPTAPLVTGQEQVAVED